MDPDRKRHKFTRNERIAIWKKYVSADLYILANCLCCGTEPITFNNHEIGHIEAFSKGGSDDFDNVRPICGNCNKKMGNKNMIEYQRTKFPYATPIDNTDTDTNVYISMVHIDNITPIIQLHSQIQSEDHTDNRKVCVRNTCFFIITVVTIVIILLVVLT